MLCFDFQLIVLKGVVVYSLLFFRACYQVNPIILF
jgi:hypothetical protein